MHHMTKNLTALALFFALILFPATWAVAGDLEPPSGPAPTMKTLQEIYEKLEQIDDKIEGGDASVPQTGQTTCWDAGGAVIDCAGTGQDGELRRGVAWPDPRFTDNGDGTVTDNLTSLVWLKDANCDGSKTWDNALTFANNLANDQCGLTDGSASGDWWLPNRRELFSLIDDSQFNPALPSDHPFTGVQSSYYWSSTTGADGTDGAWYVSMGGGHVLSDDKTGSFPVWPVRAGQ